MAAITFSSRSCVFSEVRCLVGTHRRRCDGGRPDLDVAFMSSQYIQILRGNGVKVTMSSV